MASEAEVRVASEAKDEVIAASEGPVTLITNGPMSLWPLNATSDSTNPWFNEFSQIRSFSCVPQTLSGGAIDFVSSTEVKRTLYPWTLQAGCTVQVM